MKIGLLQTNTILASWSVLAIAQYLREMGHEVEHGLIPVNEHGQVRRDFRPVELERIRAGFPVLEGCDVVLCVAPEYYMDWIAYLYPNWHTLPVRAAWFVESSKRGAFDYPEVAKSFTHCLTPDPADPWHYARPFVDTRQFSPSSQVPKTWDAGFIGTLYQKRADFLNRLFPLIPDVDFRWGTINMRDLDGERQEDWADAMVNNIRRLKIHVNLPSNNPMTCARPMETMACGTLCLSYQPNDNLFTHNKHLLYYRDVKECAFLIKIWSQDPGVYDLLAENGMRYVRENFSLKSRLEEVLEYVSG